MEWIEPQPMQRDRGEILRALIAANGGKMLAKDAPPQREIFRIDYPDLFPEYGRMGEQWVIDQVPGLVFGYAVSKVGNALKQVYHDHATGKKAPNPEEFRKILRISGASVTISGGEATLTVTHKDGSVDSR